MRRLVLAFVLLAGATGAQAPPPGATLHSQDVIAHLERVINWYRHVESLGQSSGAAGDVLLSDTTHRNALGALQLAFDFAKAEAAYKAARKQPEPSDDSQNPTTAGPNMQQFAARAAARVTGLEAKLDDIDAALAKSPSKTRPLLEAQKKELEAELNLAKEIQKSVQSMVNFAGSGSSAGGSADGGLAGQINDLQRTVPESRHEQTGSPTAHAAAAGAASSAPHPESQGLVGLIIEVISESRAKSQMQNLLGETDALLKNIDELRSPVAGALRQAIRNSDAMAAAVATDTVDQLTSAQKQIASLTVLFKELNAVRTPLTEEEVLVEAARGNLADWRTAASQQFSAAIRYLLLRTAGLIIAILVILALSEIWTRATLRLVRDTRRQRQILVLRRIIVTTAIVLVLILGFVTQFGSVATYAGLLTAGLAVALQNVILSVVAYFFLIGRYGVRVGDRVTISGVTGDVIDLGLVRLYLMEIAGAGSDLHPTGRVVVFSNAVLFQPQAIYKQLPGTDYVWHTVTMTLLPDSDYKDAEQRLKKAVDSVYEQYRPAIEQQHAELQRSVNLPVEAPAPDCQLRFTDAGLEFRVRYPVELRRSADVDDQVIKALHHEIVQDPALKIAPSGMPKVQ